MTQNSIEKWRLITPILLSLVTIITTLCLSQISDIKYKLDCLGEKFSTHLTDPNIHYSAKQRIDSLEKTIERLHLEAVRIKNLDASTIK